MTKVEALIKKGVRIANPNSLEIGDDVDIDRISSDNVVLHAGTRLFGDRTCICSNARLGYETPATVENCFIGPNVDLKGGFYKGSAFLKGSSCGSGSHIREGTIFEEQASVAHTVGLKQTILFPYVTLGSLINFCDCLMSGGTSRRDHSEVGSSYIHFNYTPNQDKATPSIMGDVPRGVMLDQSPIFLGGQGGLVGPSRIAYGTVVAAGTICRNDQLKENRLVFEGSGRRGSLPFKPSGYRNIKKLLFNNFNYIGNLLALNQWYRHVRSRFVGKDMPPQLFEGLTATLHRGINERTVQLAKLRDKMIGYGQGNGLSDAFCRQWPGLESLIDKQKRNEGGHPDRDGFLTNLEAEIQKSGLEYVTVIQNLDKTVRAKGTAWLDGVLTGFIEQVAGYLPEMS